MTTYHVVRERCATGLDLWNAILPNEDSDPDAGLTQEQFEANGTNIRAYYRHLRECPNCGRPFVVREGGTK